MANKLHSMWKLTVCGQEKTIYLVEKSKKGDKLQLLLDLNVGRLTVKNGGQVAEHKKDHEYVVVSKTSANCDQEDENNLL